SAWQSASNLPEIAWKTGTSYGRKDAWSIGFNDKYVIGVWLGNFSGEGVPELTGAGIATPLLFKLFKALDDHPSKAWLKAPSDLDFRFVCPNSGLPPSNLCEHQVLDYYLPGISSNINCSHIQKYYISENDSFSYCMNCLPEAGYKTQYLEYHPVEILAFYERNNINYLAVPRHNPACEKWDNFDPPKIATPSDGHNYYMIKDEMEALVFTCQAASDVQEVVWYVNEQVYKIAAKNESVLFYPSTEGKFKISCSDDQGRNSTIEITVDFI
ncbi:MAG: penicillin-binding protein 1C, partial [Bacteroidetes bacterium]|nr:penicillin-binding protein 1C [Bacteroidota bacterium]